MLECYLGSPGSSSSLGPSAWHISGIPALFRQHSETSRTFVEEDQTRKKLPGTHSHTLTLTHTLTRSHTHAMEHRTDAEYHALIAGIDESIRVHAMKRPGRQAMEHRTDVQYHALLAGIDASIREPHTFRKSRRAASMTFFPSDDPAVARALQKQSSLPGLERTQGVASSREDTPPSLARWPRKVRHHLAKRIAKGRELLRLPTLPSFDLAHSTALDIFFWGLDFYPAYNRF